MVESAAKVQAVGLAMAKKDRDEEERGGEWGTWEELLLASAVKRYGIEDWTKVSSELQVRAMARTVSSSSSSPSPPFSFTADFTAEACKSRFDAMKRRYCCFPPDNNKSEPKCDTWGSHPVPWLEELRKLRIDHLKRELQRSDESVMGLQRKLKRLESSPDGREANGNSNGNGNEIGAPSKEEDRNGQDGLGTKNAKRKEEGGSCSESEEGVSSSLRGGGDRRRKRKGKGKGKGKGRTGIMKVEGRLLPLMDCWKRISTHRCAPFFRHKTTSSLCQDKVIRRPLELGAIREQLEAGAYVSSMHFFRDVLLMIHNARVCFRKDSPEYISAAGLLECVKREMDDMFEMEALQQDHGPSMRKRPPLRHKLIHSSHQPK